MSISEGEKRRPASVSTSCVIIAQLRWPSGQNQMNGMRSAFFALRDNAISLSKMRSAVQSTGQLGKDVFSQPFSQARCKCLRTATGSPGRSR